MKTMSSSTFSIHPSLLEKANSRDRTWPAADNGVVDHTYPATQPTTAASFATTSFTTNTLSPYSHIQSSSASPSLNNAGTPADSLSAFSESYCSELGEQVDPFFGVDFNDDDGSTPAFLEGPIGSIGDSSDHSEPSCPQTASSAPDHNAPDPLTYPLSPGPTTPSAHTSPTLGHDASAAVGQTSPKSFSQAPFNPSKLARSDSSFRQSAHQLSSKSDEPLPSEEDMVSTTAPMPSPSPRVTVSMWGRDQSHADNSLPADTESPLTVRAGAVSTDDSFVLASYQRSTVARDEHGIWAAGSSAGPQGWGPENRPANEGASINEMEARRKIALRNEDVDRWITTSTEGGQSFEAAQPTFDPSTVQDDGISPGEIPLGSQTENKPLPGQTYYMEGSGPLTEEDFKLMRQHRLWSDAPTVYRITNDDAQRQQPETSADAIARFNQMCQETGSVLSRAATWGTRRRSLPSIEDMEGITSGSFLKKLSISRERKPSILFKELRGLVRKPSNQLLKRHRTGPEDETSADHDPEARRESRDTLAPPPRASSWTKKQQPPSLNTALVSMATGAAAIGTTHARSGSITNVTSPKSPFNLQVRNTMLRRPRSKSDLPKGATVKEESHPNLVGMWKKSGGPPVAQLARGTGAPELDDDDDEDDDLYDEGDVRTGSSNIIDEITPNLAGFKQQILKMNPRLAEQNTFLVDRIAHQQLIRYKTLLSSKVRHLQHTASHSCPSGQMCIESGGSAIPFDMKGESRGMDPLSTAYEPEEADVMPLEGAITAESFPTDIPMPPTNSLPAEFECQLCYTTKKFTKPSDWTKHVHEDVQPFTCTWDRCREPKIFKRKADWVRHENEGHRHLEWWTCDVDDCRHICYRRDNFLQHLVREHKFQEPKVKTKAAVKRAGAQDPTWQKVEKCHAETQNKPQDEPCRFCGKTLQTWKKLTVHLAKHMETMSLPILRLVSRTELDADSIISPVQDPPPRTFPPAKSEQQPFSVSPNPSQSPAVAQHPGVLAYPNAQQHSYTYNPPTGLSSFYNPSMHELQQPGGLDLGLHHQGMQSGFQTQTGYQNLPVTTGSSYLPNSPYINMPQQMERFPAFMNALGLQDASGNQIYDTAALNPPSVGGEQQQYSHHGSVSPFSRSPHQGQSGFFHQQ